MSFSLNCLVLGQASNKIFSIQFGDYVPLNGYNVEFDKYSVADFKATLSKHENLKGMTINNNIWKVKLNIDEVNKISTEEDIIKNHEGNKNITENPMLLFKEYYNNVDEDKKPDVGFLHIFIISSSTGSRKRKISRCFCSSNRLNPESNFYIRPQELVEDLGSHIVAGKFCLFHGHRQSGKTTAAWELKHWIETNSKYTVCYLNFNSGIITDKGLSEFWRSICVKVKSVLPDEVFFSAELKKEKIDASVFEELFNKDKTTLRDIILIIDEASRLIEDNDKIPWPILKDFIASLRVLRDQRGDISIVYSVVLIGTEVIKDFLLARAQSNNSTSTISPFSAEGVFNSSRFTSLEVKELLAQYVKENKREIDVDNIAADIYSLTLGHKGLVGACCCYLEEKIMYKAIEATFDDWEEHVPILLPQYIKDLATYKSIIRYLKVLSDKQREILGEVLRYGNKEVLMDEDDVKFLLAEGMVVVISQNGDGTGLIGCSAPILRSIMLSSIRGPNIMLNSLPTNTGHIDPKWLLARTVENLSIQNIFHEKTFNANNEPSEYAFQAEFLGVFKQLISKVYPSLGYRVLPEVKEHDEGGRRRQRLDILVHNKSLPIYGFELSVDASKTVFDDHLVRSNYYSCIHKCNKMYTIDISPSEKLANYIGKQKYENVIPVHVIYNLEDGKAKLVYEGGDKEEVSLTGCKWKMMWD